MVMGTLLVGIGLLMLGWAPDITGAIVSEEGAAKVITIVVAILAIYVLDFSINAVQASCRALIVDSLPAQQQQIGSAWGGCLISS